MSGASTSIRMLRSFTAVLTVGLISCATVPVPTEQLAVAMLAISNAIDAGAAQYAGGDLKSAQEKMSNARAAMTREDYVSARYMAEQAQVDARLAEKKSQAAKAERAAATTQEDSRVLREEINRKAL